jgi:ribosomal protein S12 methylthiotransferase accessory factor
METPLSSLLAAAAVALTEGGSNPRAAALLQELGYAGATPGDAVAHARILRAGASFRRLFRLPVPDSPGLVFFGAEADPAGIGPHNAGLPVGGFAGSGLTTQRAFESCVGEGIEYLSQFTSPHDQFERGPFTAFAPMLDSAAREFVGSVLSACDVPRDRAIDWIPVQRLPDRQSCLYPVDLCLRRRHTDFVPPLKLSTGCAAGPTHADAALHAILELIERDALALWWRGGIRPHAINPGQSAQASADLLGHVRRDETGRHTQLLDITTDLGVPVVAAFSTRPDGYGFAVGLGARPTLADACRSAIFEMCQSELSLHVITAKQRQSGTAALNQSDLRQNANATRFDTRRCPLLQPDEARPEVSVPASLEAVLQRLEARGIVAYALDLTRPQFDVPVMRVIAPGLQNEPCRIDTDRLTSAIARTGGGKRHTGDITLL